MSAYFENLIPDDVPSEYDEDIEDDEIPSKSCLESDLDEDEDNEDELLLWQW